MKIVPAYTQAILEGARWLGEEEVIGDWHEDYCNGDYRTLAIRGLNHALRRLPAIDGRSFLRWMIHPSVEPVMSIGIETIVVGKGDTVQKYLSGKTASPEVLRDELRQRYEVASEVLGGLLVPTVFDIENLQLLRFGKPEDYVRMTQPYLKIVKLDPHKDEVYLRDYPEVRRALGPAFGGIEALTAKGIYFDVVKDGNLAQASVNEKPMHTMIMDVITATDKKHDFSGLPVPFWSSDWYLRYIHFYAEKFAA